MQIDYSMAFLPNRSYLVGAIPVFRAVIILSLHIYHRVYEASEPLDITQLSAGWRRTNASLSADVHIWISALVR